MGVLKKNIYHPPPEGLPDVVYPGPTKKRDDDDYCDCDERCLKCGRRKRPKRGPRVWSQYVDTKRGN